MIAHDIAKNKKLPAKYDGLTEALLEDAERAFAAEDTAREHSDKLIRSAERVKNANDGRELADFLKARAADEQRAAEWLAQKRVHHGLHVYRYEQMSDGSVVALYVTDKHPKTVKFKAFDSITEASEWSPREER